MPGLNLLAEEVHDIFYILKIRINIFMLSDYPICIPFWQFHKDFEVSVHDTRGVRNRTVVILTKLNIDRRRSPVVLLLIKYLYIIYKYRYL